MPNRTTEELNFGRLGRRHLQANFQGGDLSSDGGLMLLRQIDARTGLSRLAAKALTDRRAGGRIRHRLRDLIAQRLYGLCCGYEDLNDHDTLRSDLLMQTAVGRDQTLASSPTLSRLETGASRADAWALHQILVEHFIASFASPPQELILDVDASDIPLHGEQELKQFHAYYDHHCYLPLYVFCGQSMLACLLRPSRIDGARHASAVLRLLVTRLLRWCERANVQYIIGLARNTRLQARVKLAEQVLERDYRRTGSKQRLVSEFIYAAASWNRPRRVLTRLEYGVQGVNPRFVVTNIAGSEADAVQLYDQLYCARGEAENRIKEAQLDLFGTRASCHRFAANQFRLLLAALAYTLMQRLRELALRGTELERASAATIRVRLLKIGAAIVRNTRRVRILLASHHPLRHVFAHAAHAMAP
tara:strand:+ start:90 stop:1343 length:1254 start_codon:yes stop_codon:yes gene_type:complete